MFLLFILLKKEGLKEARLAGEMKRMVQRERRDAESEEEEEINESQYSEIVKQNNPDWKVSSWA